MILVQKQQQQQEHTIMGNLAVKDTHGAQQKKQQQQMAKATKETKQI